MNVLVINSGSSSLKYQLINVATHEVLAKGNCERVGTDHGIFKHVAGDKTIVHDRIAIEDHDAAMVLVLEALVSEEAPAVSSLSEIDAIGHRIVQGGKYFDRSCIVDDDVIAKIDELSELGPLHNPPALMGIRACQHHMPGVPMVTVFDTSFFQTLPPKAYMYPIPYELYEKYAIRKYGAHGTSHRYVSARAAEILGKPLEDLRIITCHLGNGGSLAAVKGGIAIDTSMGLTPLDGLMMGTRTGSIDPAVVTFIMEHEGLTPGEMDTLLNKKSGLLGVSGVSNDMRLVLEAIGKGNERARLAEEMYAYSIQKFIGQYLAIMGGVDVIVLTAGVGENNITMRAKIFEGLEPLGMIVDPEKNDFCGEERIISPDDAPITIMVVPTNEEWMIAHDTADLVSQLK